MNLVEANRRFFEERLEDTSLLENAVVVECDGLEDIAVPVGGKRRGGYLGLDSLKACREATKELRGKPGFPNLRTVRGAPHCVEWGDPQPRISNRERGVYFGYSELAIKKFVATHGEKNE